MKATCGWVLVAGLVGLLGGAALGYFEARPWKIAAPGAPVAEERAASAPAASNAAKVVVPETVYHFGNMESWTSQRRVFPIRNEGTAALTVTFASATCKCTAVELNGKPVEQDGRRIEANSTAVVPPGGEAQVMLEWAAKVAAGPFRHGATFNVFGDPNTSRVELTVEGEVVASTTLEPSQLFFGSVPADKQGTAELFVMAFLEPEVKILSHELTPRELAEQIEISIDPVGKGQLPSPEALAGVKVTAVYSPRGTLGSFTGSLKLETNLEKAQRLDVPIYGTVRGDISIIGKGWTEANGILRMDPANSAEGGTARLNVAIRGEHVDDTELSVAKVEPPVLKVTLGERKTMRDKLVWIPLTVEIPPGTRPMVRAGEDQGGEGEIVLATTHPVTHEVKMRVQFTVQP